MSQVSPGWYPDPSGRFAQRYHDGSRWTEHVADAQGNRDTDAPVAQAGPASHADSAQHSHSQQSGQAAQRSSDPYGRQPTGAERGDGGQSPREYYGQDVAGSGRGYDPGRGNDQRASGSERGYDQWAAREQDRGQEGPGSSRRYGDQRADARWDQASAESWQRQPGGSAGRNEWPPAQGAAQHGADRWAPTPTGGPATGRDSSAAGQGPGRYAAGPHDGQPGGYGQPAGYQDPGYGYAPTASSPGFAPTLGLIVAGVGAVLLLLSLFGLNFLELSFPGLSRSVSLGDIAGDFGEGAPGALATYADFGRYLAVLVAVFAILAVVRVVPQLRNISALPAIVAVACGAFALWHVLAMLANADEGVDVSPTFGAFLGLLGYVALAAGPFLRQPLQTRR
jgi:Protein of unknown function (DUF2510)